MKRPNSPLVDRMRHWTGYGIDFSRVKTPYGGAHQPFWLKLPAWLARRGRGGHGPRISSRMLRDIESGQYALFLFARLHDDVVDGAAMSRAAVYAGDDLLIEAERQFARHVGEDAWFWRRFRTCVTESLRAVAEIDERQRRPGALDRAALHLYARLCRILLVGAAAACVTSDRRRGFRRVVLLADELAIARQILDDLLDVDEDLAAGRFNFAANALGIEHPPGSAAADGRLRRAVLIEDAVGSILSEIDGHLDQAAGIAASMKLPEAVAHVDLLRAHSRALATALQRTRVEHLFAEVLSFPRQRDGAPPPPSEAAGDLEL
jgi:hypothetical protein